MRMIYLLCIFLVLISVDLTEVDHETGEGAEEVDPGTEDGETKTRTNSKAACRREWLYSRSLMKSK